MSAEAFIRVEHLADGKGPAARMVVISCTKLRELLDAYFRDAEVAAEDGGHVDAESVYEAIIDTCEEIT